MGFYLGQALLISTDEHKNLNNFLLEIEAPERLQLIKSIFAYISDSSDIFEGISVRLGKYYKKIVREFRAWESTVDLELDPEYKLKKSLKNNEYYYLGRLTLDSRSKRFSQLIELIQIELLTVIYRRVHSKSKARPPTSKTVESVYDFIRALVEYNTTEEYLDSISDLLNCLELRVENIPYGKLVKVSSDALREYIQSNGFEALSEQVNPDVLRSWCRLLSYLNQNAKAKRAWLEDIADNIFNPSRLKDIDFRLVEFNPKEGWVLTRSARQNQFFDDSFDHLSQSEYKELVKYLKDHLKTERNNLNVVAELFPLVLSCLTGWLIRNISKVWIDPHYDEITTSDLQEGLVIDTELKCYRFHMPRFDGDACSVERTLPIPDLLLDLALSLKPTWNENRSKYSETSINQTIVRLRRSLGNSRINISKIEYSFFNYLVQSHGLVAAEWLSFSRYKLCNTRRYTTVPERDLEVRYHSVVSSLGLTVATHGVNQSGKFGSTKTLPSDRVNAMLEFLKKKSIESERALKQGISWTGLIEYHYWFSSAVQAVLSLSTNHRPVHGAFGILPNYREDIGFAFVSDKTSSQDQLVSERYLSNGARKALVEYKRHLSYLISVLDRYEGRFPRRLKGKIRQLLDGNPRVSAFFVIEDNSIRLFRPSEWFQTAASCLGFSVTTNFYRHNWASWCYEHSKTFDLARLGMGHEERGQFFISRYTPTSITDYVEYLSEEFEAYISDYPIASHFPLQARKINRGKPGSILNDCPNEGQIESGAFRILVPAEFHRQYDRTTRQRKLDTEVQGIFLESLESSNLNRPLTEEEYKDILTLLHNRKSELGEKKGKALEFAVWVKLTENYERNGGYFDSKRSYAINRSLNERPAACNLYFGRYLDAAYELRGWVQDNAFTSDSYKRLAWVFVYCQFEGGFRFKSFDEFIEANQKWLLAGKPKVAEVGTVGVDLVQWNIAPTVRELLSTLTEEQLCGDLDLSSISTLSFLKEVKLQDALTAFFLVTSGGFELERRVSRKGIDYPVYLSSFKEAKITRQTNSSAENRAIIENSLLRMLYREIRLESVGVSFDRWAEKIQQHWNYAIRKSSNDALVTFLNGFWSALINKDIPHDIKRKRTYINYLRECFTYIVKPLDDLLHGRIRNEEFKACFTELSKSRNTLVTVFNHLQNYLVRGRTIESVLYLFSVPSTSRKVDAFPIDRSELMNQLRTVAEPQVYCVERLYELGLRGKELFCFRKHHIENARSIGILTIEATSFARLKNTMSNRAFSYHRAIEKLPMPSWMRQFPNHLSLAEMAGQSSNERFTLPKQVTYSLRNFRHNCITNWYLESDCSRQSLWQIAQRAGHSTPQQMIETYVNRPQKSVLAEQPRLSLSKLSSYYSFNYQNLKKQHYRYFNHHESLEER